MVNYSYNDRTNVVLPCVDFISSIVIEGKIKTRKSRDIYKDDR
jgi:hypothetical protein